MKTHAFMVMVLAAATLPAADSSRAPAERPRLTQELRQRAKEVSRARNTEAAQDDDVLALEPLVVTEPYRRRPQEEVPTNHPFTFREGGTFWRRDGRHFTTAVKFQANPNGSGFDLVSFSW